MTDYQPIDCTHHDYLEVACVAKIPVEITLTDSETVSGLPIDVLHEDGAERLVIRNQDGAARIRLDRIATMQALIDNPHFRLVDFRSR